jgi:hypothetical protein
VIQNTRNLCSVLVRDHILHPKKTVGKNIILYNSSTYSMHHIIITKLKSESLMLLSYKREFVRNETCLGLEVVMDTQM